MATLLKPSIIRPEHKVTQDEMIQIPQTLFPKHLDWKQAEAMIRNSQIQQRYIVLLLAECVTNSGFESKSLIYNKEAQRLGIIAARDALAGGRRILDELVNHLGLHEEANTGCF